MRNEAVRSIAATVLLPHLLIALSFICWKYLEAHAPAEYSYPMVLRLHFGLALAGLFLLLMIYANSGLNRKRILLFAIVLYCMISVLVALAMIPK